MTDIDMAAEVTRCLDKLGTTPEQIRTSLVDLGIKGQRGAYVDCPLARYLREALPERHPAVHTTYVTWNFNYGSMELTNAQVTFVHDFDNFRYPELVDPGARSAGAISPSTSRRGHGGSNGR